MHSANKSNKAKKNDKSNPSCYFLPRISEEVSANYKWNSTKVKFKYEKNTVAKVFEKNGKDENFENVTDYVRNRLYEARCSRESFRTALFSYLTMSDCDVSEEKELQEEASFAIRLNGYEKFLLRYNYCIHNSVDTNFITPLHQDVIERICNRLSERLRSEYRELIHCILGQIKNDYIISMKKTTIDFVLDEASATPGRVYTLPIKMGQFPESWKQSFVRNRARLKNLIHITNPCLVQIHSFWQKTYRDFVLVNSRTFTKAQSAQELLDYHLICQKNFSENLRKILDEYYSPILGIICAVNRNKMVPSKERPIKRKHFYSCVDTLMTSQMQQLIVNSMKSYTNLLVQPASVANEYGLSGFVVRFIFEDRSVGLEPTWSDFEEVIFYVFELLMKASKAFPKVEELLKQPVLDMKKLTPKDYLRPIIFDEFIEDCKSQIRKMLEKEREAVMEHAVIFEKYSSIITGQAYEEVQAFLTQEDLTYDSIGEQVLKYDSICYDISTSIPPVIFSGLFEIHCEVLNRNLLKKTEELIGLLLHKMISAHNAANRRVCAEYSDVVSSLQGTPATTKDLMLLIETVTDVRDNIAPKLLVKLQDCHESLVFLLDHGSISVEDMKLNVETFLWKDELERELEICQQTIEQTKNELQAALMMKKSSLKTRLELFDYEVNQLRYYDNLEKSNSYYETVSRLNQGTIEISQEIEALWNEEMAYGWPITAMPLKTQVVNNLKPFLQFFELIKDFEQKLEAWMYGPRSGIIPDVVEQESETFLRMFFKLEKTFAEYDGFKQMAVKMKQKVEEFRSNLPLINALFHPGMADGKFWKKIFEIIGFSFDHQELTLSNAISMSLEPHLPLFEPIAEFALKEYSLKQLLLRMKEEWTAVAFTVIPYKETGTFVIASIEDIQILLDDHLLKTQTMKFSLYIEQLLEETTGWYDTITLLSWIIEEWLKVQAAWMYLEPIFSSPEIVNQMMGESRKFASVDRMWRDFMAKVNENPLCMEVVVMEKLLSKLQKANDTLDVIQKSINNYLEVKRLYFPRFFFLSNDELLDILSETKDPKRVQPHLKKCFEGINTLKFDEDSMDIVVMVSGEGEEIELSKRVSTANAKGSVEKWLLDLEKVMITSMRKVIKRALKAYNKEIRGTWVKSWPGQSVLCVTQKVWTARVHESIKGGEVALKEYLEVNNEQIEKVVKIVRGELSLQNRITLQALVVLDVHARDIVAQLLESRVQSDDDFQWLCQLRYYWQEKRMNTRMVNCELKYGYEYLGNTPRLVITPLTDRCYRTLFGALHLNLGGAPEGPAGTGKTETTKDLAKAVAKQCIVFNCSDGLDYIALGKFFKGLASCGAWSCFDEFNRIELEVLSVVAQQILTIQQGIKAGLSSMEFEGTTIGLDRTCSVFITMNPGYAGRTELPDNLKALFRPVAMMVPDYAMISEISLYSCGFIDARPLAVKVVATYRLCSEQLSYQSHYDYGMRAVKSVLTAAANLKLKRPDENEDILMLQSIIDVNLPKFLLHDLPLFTSITVDLFPGVSLPETDYNIFNSTAERVCKQMGLQCTPYFLEITHRIYEMMIVRHGFMIVGRPFAGKTSAFKVTAETLCTMARENLLNESCVEYKVINPKSITIGQLYGSFDATSHEWNDGVLATSYRDMASSNSPNRQWLIFDGPIDAVWIESMNTVLDDNKKLCLMSGEIIQMPAKMSLIFETLDLSMASPATVSRCGMIYMTPDLLTWRPLFSSWLDTLPPIVNASIKSLITSLFDKYVDATLDFVKANLREVLDSNKCNLVTSLMRLMQTMMDEFNSTKWIKEKDKRTHIEYTFFFSLVWSLGATCVGDSQAKFSFFLREIMMKTLQLRHSSTTDDSEESMMSVNFPEELLQMNDSLFSRTSASATDAGADAGADAADAGGGGGGSGGGGGGGGGGRGGGQAGVQGSGTEMKKAVEVYMTDCSVYDFFINKERRYRWDGWQNFGVEAVEFGKDHIYSDLIVPTVDTIRATALLDLLVSHNFPTLFIGPSGSGKSVVTKNYMLTQMNKSLYVPNSVSFSSQMTSLYVQNLLLSKLQKKGKGRYGGPPGKSLVFLIDDLHMPTVEQFGAQPPIELLRQLLDQRYWFDVNDTSTLHIADMNLIGCITQAGNSKMQVTPRFLRHFNIIALDDYSPSSLKRIFTTIFDWHLSTKQFPEAFGQMSEKMVQATLSLYRQASDNLLATPAKSHYQFSLWDVSRVVQGVTLCYPAVLPSTDDMVVLWVHEVLRVFGDRLLEEKDHEWLLEELRRQVTLTLELDFEVLFNDLDTVRKPLRTQGVKPSKLTTETDNSNNDGSNNNNNDNNNNDDNNNNNNKKTSNNKRNNKNNTSNVSPLNIHSFSRLIFCDFGGEVSGGPSGTLKLYREAIDYERMVRNVEAGLEDYNDFSKKPIDLVVFRYTVQHVARITRVLRQPGGHMLMVGLGGTGRHSLSKLATQMMDYELFEVDMPRGYGLADWQEDLKNILKKTALNDVPGVLLFSDAQLKMESCLEDICNLLSSGDAGNIFGADEKAEICEKMRQIDRSLDRGKQTDGSMMALFNMFVKKCKNLLHVVLVMSPIGDVFRERLRKFPTLTNCCTIDWYHEWPIDALEAVAIRFLATMGLEERLVGNCVKACVDFHSTSKQLAIRFASELSRKTYITSSAFLELINVFKTVYNTKKNDVTSLKSKYTTGLEKLASAQSQVSVMQVELTELKPLLEVASKKVDEVMVDIERDSKEVYNVEKNVKVDELQANEKAKEATKIKEECDAELADAMVVMDAANAALNTLTSNDISIVKSMKNPPSGVKLIMEAICVLKGVKPDRSVDKDGKKFDDYWKPSLRLLADNKFLESLINFDKDNVPTAIMKQIRSRYKSNPDFDPEKIKVVSSACEGLCRWLLAIEKYDIVAKIVAPKKMALNEAQKKFEKAMAILAGKQRQLNEVRQKLAKLKTKLEENEMKKMELVEQVDLCSLKLVRAEKLIGGLGSEKERWEMTVKQLSSAFTTFAGNCLISAAFAVYLGPYTSSFRADAVKDWLQTCVERKISCSEGFRLVSFVGDPVSIRLWNIAGLPNDAFSIDNGIILQTSRRWPLMIDPQEQANKFIRNLEASNKLQVVKLSDSNFHHTLENSMRFGYPLLLENIGEELDPLLDPVLLKQTVIQGGITVIMLGETVVEYNGSFKLYITTKLSNPHYLPELFVNVTLINFMITREGLDDQLLGIVVARERPELEASRNALVIQSAENKKHLKELEAMILEVLSKSEGNILDDESAIKVLSSSKLLSKEITQKQKVADETQEGLNQARLVYEPLSRYCRVLFFTIVELANIDPMYQNSLKWFIDFFNNSIEKAPKGSSLEERLDSLKTHFTYSLYAKTCKSLFEKDKLLFSFLLYVNIRRQEGGINEEEWSFLLKGGVGVMEGQEKAAAWLPNSAWDELCKLNALESFKKVLQRFLDSEAEWKAIYDSQEPHKADYPASFSTLTAIQRLIMLRVVRPDKMIPAIADVIASGLGPQFIESPPFDLAESFADSGCMSPLIFILSPGSDPIAALIKFAQSMNMIGPKFQSLSLGQGQGPIAERMLSEGIVEGCWVVLQNCHLAPSWMPQLERICQSMDPKVVHPGFRLWLTSYPSSTFPVSILQGGVKMTNEPPKGLRSNLLRSFTSDPLSDMDFFYSVAKQPIWKSMVFSLCFLHACIQERTKFGAIGWNIPYGFNETDLKISVEQLAEFLGKYETVQFEALKYLTGECNYGGRVTDDWDRRTLKTLVAKFYCPEALSRALDGGDQGAFYHFDPESRFYYVPDPLEYDDYINYIRDLPYNTEPSVFGMHSNMNITKEVAETKNLFAGLITAQMSSGADTKGLDSVVVELCRDVLSKLPEKEFDLSFARSKYPTAYKQSMNTVLVQELGRFNELLVVMRTSLQQLIMAIKGLVVMSPELESMFVSLSSNWIPSLWRRKSYPSLKALSFYVADLLSRLVFFGNWLQNETPPTFWISGFFFVQAFLTGVQQNYARRHTIPIDLLTFDFKVMPESHYPAAPANGEYVNGLFVDGARWDAEKAVLAESLPKILYCPLSAIHLIPCKKTDLFTKGTYTAPVYNTSERRGVLSTTGHSTNFIVALHLPSEHPSQHWVLRGVALLCQLDE